MLSLQSPRTIRPAPDSQKCRDFRRRRSLHRGSMKRSRPMESTLQATLLTSRSNHELRKFDSTFGYIARPGEELGSALWKGSMDPVAPIWNVGAQKSPSCCRSRQISPSTPDFWKNHSLKPTSDLVCSKLLGC